MGESKKFMLVVILSFVLVLLGMAVATLAFTINATSESADTSISQYKELVRTEAESQLYDFTIMLRDPDIRDLLVQGSENDSRKLAVSIFNMLKASLGDPFYLCLIQDDRVIVSKLPGETGESAPEDLLSGGSEFIEDFRGKTGQLLMLAAPVSEELRVVMVMDKTDEIEEALQPFEDQKSRAWWISILLFLAFLVLAVGVALFVVGWANKRYISGPIKELEDQAKRMMEGETDITIKVDENSDYYALQALLDSMQRMLREMESRSG